MNYNLQKQAIKKRTVREGFVIIFMATHGTLWPWIYYANEKEDDDK